jgi:hypothetical protein
MKIFISNDFFAHSYKNKATYHLWAFELIKNCLLNSNEHEVNFLHEDKEISHELLSQGAYEILEKEALLVAKSHMKKVLVKYDLVILFEPIQLTKDFIYDIKKDAIFFYVSPIRFAKDVLFSVKSTCEDIQEKLEMFNVKKSRIKDLANYWKHLILEKKGHGDFMEGSSLIVGQVDKDLSVWNGEKMLSLKDYETHLAMIAEASSCIYFKDHPNNKSGHNNWLIDKPNVKKTKENIYRLLASKNIENVYAISSSVVDEARYFGKNSFYLYEPFFNKEEDYSIIDSALFSTNFWSVLIDNAAPKADKVWDDIYIRPFRNMHWAYPYLKNLGNIELPEKTRRQKNFISKYIKSLSKRLMSFKIK